jgi:predicted component of viral defense system (DUF524 family)
LLVISAEEAAKQGTAPVQLRESCRYSYEIGGVQKDRKIELEPNRLISRYKNVRLLETRASAGRLHLHLTEDGKRVATGIVEIRSIKLDYLEEYRGMLRGLAEDLRGYIFDLGALTSVPMVTEWSEDAPSLAQQVEYLRTTLAGREFRGVMAQILRYPNEKLEAEPDIRPIQRPFRAGKSFHSQIAMGGARTAVPPGHSLYGVMMGLGIADPSLPSKVRVASKRRSLDTPENRFVKFALKSFSRFLDHAEEMIILSGEGKKKYEPVLRDIKDLQSRIARHLAAGMFSEVGELRFVPMGSPVLQRKAGYREVLRHWLEFRLSSKIKWAGAEEVMGGGASDFDAGKKDLPALYEAWLFSQLFKLFCAKFGVTAAEKRKLLDENDPLNFVIKHGRHASFKGLKTGGHRNIQGEFHYNRSFNEAAAPGMEGSWTRILRPDFTMSFWPDGLDKNEAERLEQMVHVHFDAKYRVGSIDAIFGKNMNESSLDEEKRSQREGNYNRGDLLKMHAYRDAIRRSEGAYVLYPGEVTNAETDNKNWRGFHELLPGLGAFAIKPAADGSAKGIEHLGKFLDEVLDLLSNGVSFLEHRRQGTRHMAQTHQKWESDFGGTTPYILSGLPGLLNDIADGPNSSHMVSVLVGWCKDEAHLRWIEERGLYNVRLGEGVSGAVEILDPRIVGTRVVALRKASGAINGLWRLKSKQGAKAWLKTKMLESGYPSPNHQQYLVFPVKRIPGYEAAEWNLEGLKRIRSVSFDADRLGEPILLSLAEFLHVCLGGAAAKSEFKSEFSAETPPAAPEPKKAQYETKRKMKARQRKEAKK